MGNFHGSVKKNKNGTKTVYFDHISFTRACENAGFFHPFSGMIDVFYGKFHVNATLTETFEGKISVGVLEKSQITN